MFIDASLDPCTSGFPVVSTSNGESSQGNRNKATTRLFPNLKFGCHGKIVRVRAAVVNRNGEQMPMVQIWRENWTHSGLFFKPGSDIPLVANTSVCARHRLSGGIFRCTLTEAFQVSVQPEDILGLELPPTKDVDFDIKFTTSEGLGTMSYIFGETLGSAVHISQAVVNDSNATPQISILVILGKLVTCIIIL